MMEFNVFDSIKIGLASPEQIRAWSYGEVKNRKQSTIVLLSRKETVCSVSVFSVPRRTGSATVENISAFAIGARYATVAAWVTRAKVRRERMVI